MAIAALSPAPPPPTSTMSCELVTRSSFAAHGVHRSLPAVVPEHLPLVAAVVVLAVQAPAPAGPDRLLHDETVFVGVFVADRVPDASTRRPHSVESGVPVLHRALRDPRNPH